MCPSRPSTDSLAQATQTISPFLQTFMASLNVPGLHLHFISDDLQHGGHLLECVPKHVKVGLQFISKFEMSLPMTLDYLTLDFQRDIEQDLDQAEK